MSKRHKVEKPILLIPFILLMISTCFLLYLSQYTIKSNLERTLMIRGETCCSANNSLNDLTTGSRRFTLGQSRLSDGRGGLRFGGRNWEPASRFSKPRKKKYQPNKRSERGYRVLTWTYVRDLHNTRVMSAFYDTVFKDDMERTFSRPRLDKRYNDNKIAVSYIRVIAVARILQSPLDLTCLLWFKEEDFAVRVLAEVDIVGAGIRQSDNFTYQPIILSCKLPDAKEVAGKIEEVSIVAGNDIVGVNNLLEVITPTPPQGSSLTFGHCMSVAYSYHEPYSQVEWAEFHREMGVSEFNVYASFLHDHSDRVYKRYSDMGKLNMFEIELPVKAINETSPDEAAILLNMSPVLNHCMYTNMYRYDRIVVSDIDEIIVPRFLSNYSTLLKEVYGKENYEDNYRDISFTNVYYFTDIKKSKKINKELWFLKMSTFKNHVMPSRFGSSAKTIMNPRLCKGLQNHYCWAPLDRNIKPINANISFASNHHYKECHLDKFYNKKGMCSETMKEITYDPNVIHFEKIMMDRVIPILVNLSLIEVIG